MVSLSTTLRRGKGALLLVALALGLAAFLCAQTAFSAESADGDLTADNISTQSSTDWYISVYDSNSYETIAECEDGVISRSKTVYGISYAGGVITLNGTNQPNASLNIEGLGNATVKVEGACYLNSIYAYGTSLTIDGTGTLTLNKNKTRHGTPLTLEKDWAKRDVKLNVSSTVGLVINGCKGDGSCIRIEDTTVSSNAITFGNTTNLGSNAVKSIRIKDVYGPDAFIVYEPSVSYQVNAFQYEGSVYGYAIGGPHAGKIGYLLIDTGQPGISTQESTIPIAFWRYEVDEEELAEIEAHYNNANTQSTAATAYDAKLEWDALYAQDKAFAATQFYVSTDANKENYEGIPKWRIYKTEGFFRNDEYDYDYAYGTLFKDSVDNNSDTNEPVGYALDGGYSSNLWYHAVKASQLVHTPKVAPAPASAPAPAPQPYVNSGTVSAASIRAIAASGTTTITLGNKVKKIAPNTFAGSGIKTLVLVTSKLKAGSVKNALKGSNVKVIKVQAKPLKSTKGLKGKAKRKAKEYNKKAKAYNKKLANKYKKIFTKKICGAKVRVTA